MYVNPRFVMFKVYSFPDQSFSYPLSLPPSSMSVYFRALLPLILLLLKHLLMPLSISVGITFLARLNPSHPSKASLNITPQISISFFVTPQYFIRLSIFYAVFSQLYLPLGHDLIRDRDNVMLFYIIVRYQK